jgi:hypothetical protein
VVSGCAQNRLTDSELCLQHGNCLEFAIARSKRPFVKFSVYGSQ